MNDELIFALPADKSQPAVPSAVSQPTTVIPVQVLAHPDPTVQNAALKPGEDYMISHQTLDAVCLVAHRGLRILRCLVCHSYLTTGSMKGHLDKHPFPISADALAAAITYCATKGIYGSQMDVPLPYPMGPPVQGIPTVLGYTCQMPTCQYAVVNLGRLRQHEKEMHSLLPHQGPPRVQSNLQGLFANPIRYFTVNPSLSTCDEPAVPEALAADFLPMATESEAILTATDDRGRTPLDKYLQLDDLLLDTRHSRPRLANLASLKQGPQEPEAGGMYTRLAVGVKDWHKTVGQRMKGHPAKFDLERIIIYGPQTIPISR